MGEGVGGEEESEGWNCGIKNGVCVTEQVLQGALFLGASAGRTRSGLKSPVSSSDLPK